MIANAALLVRPLVALVFLAAGLLMLRTPATRTGGWLIAIGAVLFGGAEAYGVITVRPFVGGPYDEHWQEQLAAIEAFSTLGLLVCAAGLVALARRPG